MSYHETSPTDMLLLRTISPQTTIHSTSSSPSSSSHWPINTIHSKFRSPHNTPQESKEDTYNDRYFMSTMNIDDDLLETDVMALYTHTIGPEQSISDSDEQDVENHPIYSENVQLLDSYDQIERLQSISSHSISPNNQNMSSTNYSGLKMPSRATRRRSSVATFMTTQYYHQFINIWHLQLIFTLMGWLCSHWVVYVLKRAFPGTKRVIFILKMGHIPFVYQDFADFLQTYFAVLTAIQFICATIRIIQYPLFSRVYPSHLTHQKPNPRVNKVAQAVWNRFEDNVFFHLHARVSIIWHWAHYISHCVITTIFAILIVVMNILVFLFNFQHSLEITTSLSLLLVALIGGAVTESLLWHKARDKSVYYANAHSLE